MNMVNELLVYCPNKNNGCLHMGQRQYLGYHLKEECEYVKSECQNGECGDLVLKKDLAEHVKNCRARLVYCESCKKEMQFSSLEKHSDNCPKRTVECSYCHTSRSLSDHEAHLEECPEMTVTCPHVEYGCIWRGHRADVSQIHLFSCSYEPLKEFFKMYKRRVETLERENNQLNTKVQELHSTVDLLQGELSTVTKLLDARFPYTTMGMIDDEHPILPPLPQELILTDNEQIKNDLATLTDSLSDLELRQNVALMSESLRIQEEMQRLREMCHGTRMLTQRLFMERRGIVSASPEATANSLNSAPPSVSSVNTGRFNATNRPIAPSGALGPNTNLTNSNPPADAKRPLLSIMLNDTAPRQETKL